MARMKDTVSFAHRMGWLRQRLYGILDQDSGADILGAAANWALIGLVVLTLLATVLESVPRLAAAHDGLFETIEFAALITFSIEYVVRLWSAVEHPPWRRLGGMRAALRFAASPAGLIDLAAVPPCCRSGCRFW
jgi:voltage-gated potassium channel